MKDQRSGDAGPPYKPSWPLFEMLMFLSDCIGYRREYSYSVHVTIVIDYKDYDTITFITSFLSFAPEHKAISSVKVKQRRKEQTTPERYLFSNYNFRLLFVYVYP